MKIFILVILSLFLSCSSINEPGYKTDQTVGPHAPDSHFSPGHVPSLDAEETTPEVTQ